MDAKEFCDRMVALGHKIGYFPEIVFVDDADADGDIFVTPAGEFVVRCLYKDEYITLPYRLDQIVRTSFRNYYPSADDWEDEDEIERGTVIRFNNHDKIVVSIESTLYVSVCIVHIVRPDDDIDALRALSDTLCKNSHDKQYNCAWIEFELVDAEGNELKFPSSDD